MRFWTRRRTHCPPPMCIRDRGEGIVIIAYQPFVFINGILENGGPLGSGLGGLHVVPEAVRGGALFQLGGFPAKLIQADGVGQVLNIRPKVFQPQPELFILQHTI